MGILCSLYKSRKSVWLGSVPSVKEHFARPGLARTRSARLGLQCAKPLKDFTFMEAILQLTFTVECTNLMKNKR